MSAGPVLVETIAGIQRTRRGDPHQISVDRAVIGLHFAGVKVDTGIPGASAMPMRSIPEAVCCPSFAMAMPLRGKRHGWLARDLLNETEAASGIVTDAFLDVLAECGSGRNFFGRSAEKVVLMRKTRIVTSCAG
jgi:hypothetical protein